MGLSNRIAVITGASQGLGLALAQEFVSNSWQVVGTGRSEKPQDFPAEIEYRQFDASNASECETFWQQFHQEHSDTEVCLVNNAGGYVSGGLLEVKPEDYAKQMQSCYFTSVYMTRGLAAIVPKARIINIVSNSALTPHAQDSAYGSAKAAQRHFFQSLQGEFKPEQYQLTNLYPSDIASHGPNPDAIDPKDLASFVRQQAENDTTYYLRDATVYPHKKEGQS